MIKIPEELRHNQEIFDALTNTAKKTESSEETEIQDADKRTIPEKIKAFFTETRETPSLTNMFSTGFGFGALGYVGSRLWGAVTKTNTQAKTIGLIAGLGSVVITNLWYGRQYKPNKINNDLQEAHDYLEAKCNQWETGYKQLETEYQKLETGCQQLETALSQTTTNLKKTLRANELLQAQVEGSQPQEELPYYGQGNEQPRLQGTERSFAGQPRQVNRQYSQPSPQDRYRQPEYYDEQFEEQDYAPRQTAQDQYYHQPPLNEQYYPQQQTHRPVERQSQFHGHQTRGWQ